MMWKASFCWIYRLNLQICHLQQQQKKSPFFLPLKANPTS